jgi:hypothetical protein
MRSTAGAKELIPECSTQVAVRQVEDQLRRAGGSESQRSSIRRRVGVTALTKTG